MSTVVGDRQEWKEDARRASAEGESISINPPDVASSQAGTGGTTPRWLVLWIVPVLVIVLLYLARSILAPFVLAGVMAYIFSPVVDRLQERASWPRALVVGLLYLAILGALGIGLYFGSEAIYSQTREFIQKGPTIVEEVSNQILQGKSYTFGGTTLDAHELSQRVSESMQGFFGSGGDVLGIAREFVRMLLDTLLVIIVSFYLLVDGKRMGPYLLKFMPEANRARTGYVAGRIHTVLGAYLRGQLYLILLMTGVSFIVLEFIFKVPYAVPLAILTGFLEILPLLGPAIAATLAGGVAFAAHGAPAAIGVIVAYTVLRLLEDQVVMPLVVGKIVELHPVTTIFAVLAGGAIAGVIGMLLAVPVAAAIKVILDFMYPTDPKSALAQAVPGIKRARREAKQEEAKQEKEEPAEALTS